MNYDKFKFDDHYKEMGDGCHEPYPQYSEKHRHHEHERPVPPPPPPSTPLPPPIPPVRYVPGMNVQEQMCNLSERINICIERWNTIQRNCYEALDQVVGAAVNNNVYYSPDEVRFSTGYDENMSCSYAIVEARAVDRSGKPIFCHLRPAYNNVTNSGARENIQDVSFITSAQMVMTASQASDTHWDGTVLFNGNPGEGTPNAEKWVAGWNRNGALLFFPGDVELQTLKQHRMVNCIGPVFPIIKNGELFTTVLEKMPETPGSIQAMGWKQFNGNKVFISCSLEDQPGMSPMSVAKIMQSMGVTNAIITSYQTAGVTAWDAMPIADGENTNGNETIPSVPGMTGGMTFLGQLTTAPIQWNIPRNCANWIISKRPGPGWPNSFTTEVANVVQRLGATTNSLNSLSGQVEGQNKAIDKLSNDVQTNISDIAELKEQISNITGNVSQFETRLSTAENNIKTLDENLATVTQHLTQEIQNRAAADEQLQKNIANEAITRSEEDQKILDALTAAQAALQNAINAEATARENADGQLQNAINEEATARENADAQLQNAITAEEAARKAADSTLQDAITAEADTRATADRNLSAGLEAEISARQTKDVQHEAQMEQIAAQEQKDNAAVNRRIDDLEEKVDNFDGGAIKEDVEKNAADIADIAGELETLKAKEQSDAENLQANINNVLNKEIQDVDALQTNINVNRNIIDQHTKDIEDLKGGSFVPEIPFASATEGGIIKVGDGLEITPDGVLNNTRTGDGHPQVSVEQGEGVEVTANEDRSKFTVSIDPAITQDIADNKAAIEAEAKARAEADADLEAGIKANADAIDELETRVDGQSTDITNIKQELEGITGENGSIPRLEDRLEQTNTALENLTKEAGPINTLNERVEKLETETTSLKTSDKAQNQEISNLNTNIIKLNNSDDQQNQEIENLKNGTNLPVASATTLGAVKIGENLEIDENGVLSATGGGGNGGGLPAGTIAMWPFEVSTIPKGWQLCDGSNGTPDYRGRFLLGADGQHELGNTGGEETVSLTREEMPEHAHRYTTWQGTIKASPVSSGAYTVPLIGNGFNTETDQSGGSKAHENMPPYYTVNFIMKMTNGGGSIGNATISAGDGVSVEYDEEIGEYIVGLTPEIIEKINAAPSTEEFENVKDAVESLQTAQTDQAAKDQKQDEEIEALETAVDNVQKAQADQAAKDQEQDTKIIEMETAVDGKVNKSGDTMSGPLITPEIKFPQNNVQVGIKPKLSNDPELTTVCYLNSGRESAPPPLGVGEPTKTDHATTKGYVDNSLASSTAAIGALQAQVESLQTSLNEKVSRSGDTMTGTLEVPGLDIYHSTGVVSVTVNPSTSDLIVKDGDINAGILVPTPEYDDQAANKKYVDNGVKTATDTANSAATAAANAQTTAQAADTKAQQALTAVSGGPFLPTSGGIMGDNANIVMGSNGVLAFNTHNTKPIFTQVGVGDDRPAITVAGKNTDYVVAPIQLGGIATPVTAHDAANKEYVDSMSNKGLNFKHITDILSQGGTSLTLVYPETRSDKLIRLIFKVTIGGIAYYFERITYPSYLYNLHDCVILQSGQINGGNVPIASLAHITITSNNASVYVISAVNNVQEITISLYDLV